MKKIFLTIGLLFASSLQALPMGNPSEASLFYQKELYCDHLCGFLNFGGGFYGDYVFNRHLETVHRKDIDTTKLFTNAAYLVVNFWDRIDLFSSLGASNLSLNTSLGAFSSADPHPLFEIETLSAFSYSIGIRATLLQYKCLALGVMGQYFSTSPGVKRMYIAAGAVSYPDSALTTHYREGQVALGLSYRYNRFFLPYVAVKYACARWKLDDGQLFIIESNTTTFLFNLRNHQHWGYGIGLSFYPPTCNQIVVTVEARFIDEKAFYINGQMRF